MKLTWQLGICSFYLQLLALDVVFVRSICATFYSSKNTSVWNISHVLPTSSLRVFNDLAFNRRAY